ncbi:MAG: hypothetical protein AAF513_17040 [Pseudomonadota bacterium]
MGVTKSPGPEGAYLWAGATCLIIGMTYPVMYYNLALLILGGLLVAALVTWAVVLLASYTYRLCTVRDARRTAVVGLLTIIITSLATPLIYKGGDRLFCHARFLIFLPYYLNIVRATDRVSTEAVPPHTVWSFRLDDSIDGVVRVVFPHVGGFLDNWRGTIYDPSGVLERQPFPQYQGLFGGDIYYCFQLWGYFYECNFT